MISIYREVNKQISKNGHNLPLEFIRYYFKPRNYFLNISLMFGSFFNNKKIKRYK
jgi:hypothetical protein